jgi:hypothetical protein
LVESATTYKDTTRKRTPTRPKNLGGMRGIANIRKLYCPWYAFSKPAKPTLKKAHPASRHKKAPSLPRGEEEIHEAENGIVGSNRYAFSKSALPIVKKAHPAPTLEKVKEQ